MDKDKKVWTVKELREELGKYDPDFEILEFKFVIKKELSVYTESFKKRS